MQEAREHRCRFLPANAQPSIVLEPCDRAFHRPAPTIASQTPSILRLHLPARTMRRDQIRALAGHLIIELIAVVRLVADEPIRRENGEHEVEQMLYDAAFVRRSRAGVDRHRQTARIHQHHDFHAFSSLGETDAITAALGLGERGIDEALVEFVAAALFDTATGLAHDAFKHASLNPLLEPAMHGALGAEAARQILPLGAVVEHPENAADDITFVGGGPTTFGTDNRIRNSFAEPIDLFFSECEHLLPSAHHRVLG